MFLLTSDIHHTSRAADAYRWDLWPWAREQITKNRLKALFILGDLTDNKDAHPAELVNRLVDEIQQTAKLCPIYILKGNHDFIDPTTPFFKFIRQKYCAKDTSC